MLAGMLVQISFFQGMSQSMKDAVRVVAILLAQVKLTSEAAMPTEDFVDWVVDKLAGVVKTATQAAIEEIKQALNALVESSTQIAASATSYQDALKNTPISAAMLVPMASLDARVRAREGIKVRHILVDALTPSQPLYPSANNMQLAAQANESLCSMGSPLPHRFVGMRQLNNGGILLKMNSEEAAVWLNSPDNKTSFLSQFALDATLKP